MALQTSATIRGNSYSYGDVFTAAASVYGRSSSDGYGEYSYVEEGRSFFFMYFNPGTEYPYAIGDVSTKLVRCWVKEDAFPYATYSVTFKANGGKNAPTEQTKIYGKDLTLTLTKPSRTGHTFKNWNTKADGTGTAYAPGASYAEDANLTLYAIWSVNTCKVNFDANGGTVTMTSMTVNWGTNIDQLPEATRPYYVFLGWYTAATGGKKITNSTVFTQDMTLYAQYVIDASVHLNVNGTYKKGIPYVKVDGVWKKGYAWIKKNGSWKQGIG